MLVSTQDTFVGDTSATFVYWDGTPSWTCNQCTFGRGSNPAPNYVTFAFYNGGNSSDPFYFVDPTFTGGASKDSNNLAGTSVNQQSAQYYIQWTYTVTVSGCSGGTSPCAGASVTLTDHLGKSASGTTNSNGQVSLVTTDERWYNDGGGAHQENHNPQTLTVSDAGAGCTTSTTNPTVTSTTSASIALSGCN